MYFALLGKVQKCSCKNSRFAQHIMHENEASEFLYTRITEQLLQHIYSSSCSLSNLPF